jgi:glutaminyl-peptide cyclotransferase
VRALLAVATVLLLAGCSAAPTGTTPKGHPSGDLRVDVLQRIPHDRAAFTQGLELADGVLYEGTGLVGESSIRSVDPKTGGVRQKIDLPANLFGEGITVAGDSIWQITWQNGIAIQRDRKTLAEQQRVDYKGEGWGLCYDQAADRLIMSDGSDRLTYRDVHTFAVQGSGNVRDADDQPVTSINELECVPDKDGRVQVWANIWQTDEIIRIDPASGRVNATVDLTGLLPEADRAAADVLNGIAHIPGTDEFLVTGKLWPTMFRVRFVTSGP